MRESFLVFGAPAIDDEEIEAVTKVLRSKWIGQGPQVAEFEQRFASYRKSPYAVAVNSCTAALQLSLMASGVQPGDEVITTALTFCATANAIINIGAIPVLVDVDAETFNLDAGRISAAVTPRTRAVIPVHFAGRMCDMEPIQALVREHKLKIIEDCAHAIESHDDQGNAGTFGNFGCFSFYATKNVTCGEGGMILCKREADAIRLRRLALHGMSKDAWKRMAEPSKLFYAVEEIGFKFNMTDINAAIGIVQLAKVERGWRRRDEIWHRYIDAFQDLPMTLPAKDEAHTRHARHLFTVLVEQSRSGIGQAGMVAHLAECNIGSGIHYRALPEHPAYQKHFGWQPEDTPNATRIGRSTVSLPLTADMSERDVNDVIAAVRSAFDGR